MRGFPDVGSFDEDDDDIHRPGVKNFDAPVRNAPRIFADISQIDLSKELTDQFAEATSFRDWMLAQAEVQNPKDVTDSVKTVNTLLGNIIKMRETVHNLQRLTALEDAVIETMKEFPEVREAFFAKLKENLK